MEEIVKPQEAEQPETTILGEEAPKPKRKRRTKAEMPDSEVMPRKSKSKVDPKEDKNDLNPSAEFFANQFYGLHLLATAITKIDCTITKEESQQVGQAVYDVIKEYDMTWLNKSAPILNLVVTIAMVELPVYLKVQAQLTPKKITQQVINEAKEETVIESGEPLQMPVQDPSTMTDNTQDWR